MLDTLGHVLQTDRARSRVELAARMGAARLDDRVRVGSHRGVAAVRGARQRGHGTGCRLRSPTPRRACSGRRSPRIAIRSRRCGGRATGTTWAWRRSVARSWDRRAATGAARARTRRRCRPRRSRAPRPRTTIPRFIRSCRATGCRWSARTISAITRWARTRAATTSWAGMRTRCRRSRTSRATSTRRMRPTATPGWGSPCYRRTSASTGTPSTRLDSGGAFVGYLFRRTRDFDLSMTFNRPRVRTNAFLSFTARTRRLRDHGAAPSRRRVQDRRADARHRGADALRRLGAAHAAGQGAPSRRRAVQAAAQARPRSTWCRSRPRRCDGVTMLKLPERAAPAARRLRAHRPRHRPRRRARPGATTASGATTRARIRCSQRPARTKTGAFKKSPFGVTLAGCPLDEKISEMQPGEGPGLRARRARDHRHRQPDVRGDRPPHLQRLHEGLHLPEAGAGRHPAGRDAHAEGRARAAVGLRDLRLLTRWNPLNLAPAAAAGPTAAARCWSSAWAPPASRSRIT